MKLTQILGRNVRALRMATGKSQEVLAFDSGLKRSYISDMERGLRNPTVKAIERLAKALEVEPDVLLRVKAPSKNDR